MAGKSYKDEDLETKYTKAPEIIKMLESRVSSLERENAYLRHQLEVLRKDADESDFLPALEGTGVPP